MERIAYTDENRISIISDKKREGKILLEDQRYTTGNYLVFVIQRPPDPVDEIVSLKQRVSALEAKINTLAKGGVS